ncbi:hypothetical protein QUF80_05180 [Desulfococcaceae bacterium HSG8]|nr:hypothetical protein [Desulfococcaceae bacterium HSG8]
MLIYKRKEAELERQRDELRKQGAKLRKQRTELERQRSELAEKLTNMGGQTSELEKQESELRKQFAELGEKLTNLERQASELEKQRTEQKRQALSSLNDRLREESEDGLAVTEEEYWEKYYQHPDFSYEWDDGYLSLKPLKYMKGFRIYQWFMFVLGFYFDTYSTGKVNPGIGFRLALPHKSSVRIPELFVVTDENPVTINDDDRSFSAGYLNCVSSPCHTLPCRKQNGTRLSKKVNTRASVLKNITFSMQM